MGLERTVKDLNALYREKHDAGKKDPKYSFGADKQTESIIYVRWEEKKGDIDVLFTYIIVPQDEKVKSRLTMHKKDEEGKQSINKTNHLLTIEHIARYNGPVVCWMDGLAELEDLRQSFREGREDEEHFKAHLGQHRLYGEDELGARQLLHEKEKMLLKEIPFFFALPGYAPLPIVYEQPTVNIQ